MCTRACVFGSCRCFLQPCNLLLPVQKQHSGFVGVFVLIFFVNIKILAKHTKSYIAQRISEKIIFEFKYNIKCLNSDSVAVMLSYNSVKKII